MMKFPLVNYRCHIVSSGNVSFFLSITGAVSHTRARCNCDSDSDYRLHTLEKFENQGFNLKTHQMFSFHTTLEKFENVTSIIHSELCLKKIRKGKSYYN